MFSARKQKILSRSSWMENSCRSQKGFYTSKVPHRTFKSSLDGQIRDLLMVLRGTFLIWSERFCFRVLHRTFQTSPGQDLFVVGFYIFNGKPLNVGKNVLRLLGYFSKVALHGTFSDRKPCCVLHRSLYFTQSLPMRDQHKIS